MFPVRLIQLIEAHADNLADGLVRKLTKSEQCKRLLHKVPAEELRRRTHEIYRHLGDWLVGKTESEIEERYIGLGVRRARQSVPFSELLWAISATKEYLWEYLQLEGLLEKPVEFFGEIELLQRLETFFDRAMYFAAMGYESVRREETDETVLPAVAQR